VNHTETFKERNAKGIDIADDVCVKYLEKNNIKYERTGFDCRDRIGKKDFCKVNSYLRAMPDFLVFREEAIFIECKGFKDTLKLKMNDVDCYRYWDKFHKVWLFLYDCKNKKTYIISLDRINKVLGDCDIDTYHDNSKPYYILGKPLLDALSL
tara:strand:+ start:37 stop:495 length:459 start_codon:yes stop_codon:yes gene_type:complete